MPRHLLAAAFHEAGHAVVAVVLDMPFDSVFIFGDWGRIDPRRENGRPIPWPADFRDAVMTAAGPVAEAKKMHRSLFNVSLDAGEDDFAYVESSGHDPTEAVRQAKKLLRANWQAVEAVAGDLILRGLLLEAEVIAHFRFSRK